MSEPVSSMKVEGSLSLVKIIIPTLLRLVIWRHQKKIGLVVITTYFSLTCCSGRLNDLLEI